MQFIDKRINAFLNKINRQTRIIYQQILHKFNKGRMNDLRIPISEFEAMENTIENFGLSKLMDETLSDESLEKNAAMEYYNNLKKNVEG